MIRLGGWVITVTARRLRSLDWPLCVLLALLMSIGLMVMHSAGGLSLVRAQAIRMGLGVLAMWAVSRCAMIRLRAWTPVIYWASVVPLVTVFFIGTGKYGRQWLDLKFCYIQPAELMKISLPMMVAWFLQRVSLPPRPMAVLVTMILIALPTALIMFQPDFGTGVLIAASGLFPLVLAGLPCWWIGVALSGFVATVPVAWFWLLRPYQKERILIFLNPQDDALGAGWNIIQSKIAIGSGGLVGKGWGQGSQSHLHFIPEQATDFAFSVHSEEFGWFGVVVVFVLYLMLVARCLWIAWQARDTYSRLLASAFGLAFFGYVLVNGGMISGLLPVVGVPMPLISYGGTSAVSLLVSLGLVMATRHHRPVHGY